MVMLCACLLLMGNLRAAEALAQRFDFDLPAAPLELALQRFAEQSGASTGIGGTLPSIRTRDVSGFHTPLDALQRMLAGSSVEAVQVGPLSFRLQPAVPAVPVGDAPPIELAEVVVTASKRNQRLLDVPIPLTVVGADAWTGSAPLGGTHAALAFDATTSSTNLGPGRDRHFIRGVADSAFLGPSQATVSVQFDEARLNYSAPDPDLRLLDVERVEILKGPQGPLYGTGALGGVVHILPQRPDLAAPLLRTALSVGSTAHGGFSDGGSVVANLPLTRDRLGLRAVAYTAGDAGWIDNIGGRADANDTRTSGGRLALRARSEDWLVDLQGAAQVAHTRDSQYVPGTAATLVRQGVLPEPRDNDLYLASVVLHGALWGGELVFSSSFVQQEVDGVQDASVAAPQFGITPPARYADDRAYRLFGNELRYTGAAGTRLSWLVGAAQLGTRNRIAGRLDPAPAAGATVLDLRQQASDLALFGEVGMGLSANVRLTTGLRLARVADEDERHEVDAHAAKSVVHTATPSISLDWRSPDRHRYFYLRFAQAVRPGGLNPDTGEAELRFHADELSNLDAGLRLATGAVTLQAALFATRWQHVQSDYLLDNGLIGTRNVGNAGTLGMEAQMRFDAGGWGAELGTVLQRARLDEPVSSVAGDDAHLPVVPDFRSYALVSRDLPLGDWRARMQLRADYSGASRLSFDPDLDRRTAGAFAVGAGARLAHGGYELELSAANLLDSHADTFAFGNPFSIRAAPQRTPRQPRTLSLQLAYEW
jgi:outer membrane receptor protein involved in Fe transport